MEKYRRIHGHILKAIRGHLCPLAINYLHFFPVQNALIPSQGPQKSYPIKASPPSLESQYLNYVRCA